MDHQSHGNSDFIMSASGLKKSYHKSKLEVPVLRDVTIEIPRGQFTAIIGQSGSGKSTLLHALGTLDAPDAGEIHYEGQRIDNLPSGQRELLRNRQFGMVFQFYHLLPELSTLENVLLPMMINSSIWKYWAERRQRTRRAKELLELVGLSHRLKHRPSELSGGEMQRVAIARSLIAEPRLLLADEPTGNLDRKTGDQIMSILRSLNADSQLTIVMVTHDNSVAETADRTLRLVEGRIDLASEFVAGKNVRLAPIQNQSVNHRVRFSSTEIDGEVFRPAELVAYPCHSQMRSTSRTMPSTHNWRYEVADLPKLSPFGSVQSQNICISKFDGDAWSNPELIAMDKFSLHPVHIASTMEAHVSRD